MFTALVLDRSPGGVEVHFHRILPNFLRDQWRRVCLWVPLLSRLQVNTFRLRDINLPKNLYAQVIIIVVAGADPRMDQEPSHRDMFLSPTKYGSMDLYLLIDTKKIRQKSNMKMKSRNKKSAVGIRAFPEVIMIIAERRLAFVTKTEVGTKSPTERQMILF